MGDEALMGLQLVGRPADPAVVETLKTLLEMARSGHLQNFAFFGAGHSPTGEPASMELTAGEVNVPTIIWSFELWKDRMIGKSRLLAQPAFKDGAPEYTPSDDEPEEPA